MTTALRAFATRTSIATMLSFGVIAIFILSALISMIWSPYDVMSINVDDRLQPPSIAHWFGTNHLGRDVLSMVMVGAQTSIAVSVFAIAIGVLIGVPMGLFATASHKVVDEGIMRLGDLIFAFPALILAILITAVFGASAVNAIIAIGVFNIPVFARVTRGAAQPFWSKGFVLAAQTCGKSKLRISVEHILPNITHLIIVQGIIQFSLAILAEAGLSYMGLGVQPPNPSWGRMLADSQTMINFAPWLAFFPGLAIFSFVLSVNIIGADVRTRLDPRANKVF